MNIQTIIVPVDLSVCSFLLAEEVASFSTKHDARVIFLHVVDVPSGLRPDTLIYPDGSKEGIPLAKHMEAEPRAILSRYENIAKMSGVEASTMLEHGSVVEKILEVADAENADLIMMGTHGRKGLARLMLGSVAEQVIRMSTIPVLTIRTLHKPSCEATSCATCTSGETTAHKQAGVELEG